YIIDDEYWARISLKDKLAEFHEIEVIGEADCIPDAIKGINKLHPDILFLDIQLTDGTGFDLINEISYSGKIIFITAFDEYALRAFEINALDYLMKPISPERLETAIKRLDKDEDNTQEFSSLLLKLEDRIMATIRDAIYFIKVDSIVLISASTSYTEILTNNGKKFLTSKSMQEWENRLPPEMFCRIHRSFIINFEHIEKSVKYSSNTALIYMKGLNDPFKLSRSYYKKVKDKYL
ncbi:LytR/AlgR family response regulator transcription factor, partial [Bacteroidota bacterium]